MNKSFEQTITDAGMTPPDHIRAGYWERFPGLEKKNSNRAGFCFLFDDSRGGVFGDFSTGLKEVWHLGEEMSLAEQATARKQIKEAQKRYKKELNQIRKEAAKIANDRWNKAVSIISHPYLEKKKVLPLGIRQEGKNLIIPIYVNDVIVSIQTITPEGEKRFQKHGQIAAGYYPIGKPKITLYICEGYATGTTIHEATDKAVAVAFNSGNLKPVAEALYSKYPDLEIVIAADNDQYTDNNPGVTKAKEAAITVNGKLVIPEFSNTDSRPTDFNDLATLEGLERVRELIDSAQAVEEPQETTTVNQGVIQKIGELGRLSDLEYEKIRKQEAKALNIRATVLDKEIAKERERIKLEMLAHDSIVSDVEEWSEAIQGDQLLSELQGIYKQYAILPEGADIALSLWTLGTYCFDAFRIYPMIGLTSPEKRCGKSTVMSLLQGLTNKSLLSSNISPAAIYRVAEMCKPTLLIDEADTFMKDNDELRGIINSGHTRDTAFVIRIEGDNLEPKRFSTWTPKALAMIGDLPDTIKDRSIVVSMRRKMSGETVLKMPLNASEQFLDVRRKCKRWAIDNFDQLARYVPTMPSHNNDREIDNWTPLFSIAGLCGQEQDALDSMVKISPTGEDDSIGLMILGDIKVVFDKRGVEKIFSRDLVEDLIEFDDRPWAEWKRGKPMTKTSLARLLKPFKIKSKDIRFGPDVGRGYVLKAFKDTFLRYLPPDPHSQSATVLQTNDSNALSDNSKCYTRKDVALQNPLKPAPGNDCSTVADENRDKGGNACIPHVQVTI